MDVRVDMATPKKSLRSLWSELRKMGAEVSYETFLRWIRLVEDEAVRRGYMNVRRGKRKRYIIKKPENLMELLYENGFAF
jgi:hypothetical protein